MTYAPVTLYAFLHQSDSEAITDAGMIASVTEAFAARKLRELFPPTLQIRSTPVTEGILKKFKQAEMIRRTSGEPADTLTYTELVALMEFYLMAQARGKNWKAYDDMLYNISLIYYR